MDNVRIKTELNPRANRTLVMTRCYKATCHAKLLLLEDVCRFWERSPKRAALREEELFKEKCELDAKILELHERCMQLMDENAALTEESKIGVMVERQNLFQRTRTVEVLQKAASVSAFKPLLPNVSTLCVGIGRSQ